MIFVKNPQRGKVKTRLAQTLGDDRALGIYLKLLNHTMQQAKKTDCTKEVWYSSHIDNSDLFSPDLFSKKLQTDGDLGNKMSNAFKNAFAGGNERVVIIGSDCPEITSERIEKAFDLLASNELVIGPANDGGYYLLGINRFIPELFEDMPWSTPAVYGKTIEIAKSHQVSVEELPVLIDIDTEEDLKLSKFNWLQ
ncbi:MAG: TIGR04282 family arsenosugar biosynthesis glycosyltransferase [Balneolaceae bacterium]|nr:TIGR04282 family arsenosugar biosynthesis glycosyltransferase [Balneolaceae bacterium]